MISVCLATYNGEKYIEEQLMSILAQLSAEDEIIVSDDGSTDSTLDIVKGFNDPRIKIFRNENINGYGYNFQNALDKANGDFVFLSDQDDVWCENKVAYCMEYLREYDFVVHDARVVNEHLKDINNSYFKLRRVKSGFIFGLFKIGYLGCCMAFTREVLEYASPMPIKDKVITHDSWLTLIAELQFKIKLINNPLILYRRHGENTSNGGKDEGNTILFKLYIRVYSLLKLIGNHIYQRRKA